MVEDRKSHCDAASSKFLLYHALMKVWQDPAGQHILAYSDRVPAEIEAEVRSRTLSALSRAVFLLMNLDGFSAEKARAILEVDQATFDNAIEQANQEVNQLLATDVLIIEDELLIAEQLETIMRSLGHYVTNIARTAKKAIKVATQYPPRLILSDIQLADGSSGIDAVNEITKTNPVPAIFITAFPERLLTGLRPEPTYLISKPFRPEQIKAVVSQAVFFDAKIRWKVPDAAVVETLAGEWTPC